MGPVDVDEDGVGTAGLGRFERWGSDGAAAPDGSFSGITFTIDRPSDTIHPRTLWSFDGAGSSFTYAGPYGCG